jgi:hypothetical protein
MTDCSEFAVVPGMTTASIVPCRIGAAQSANTCTFAGAPASATCTLTIPLDRASLVSYVASAVAADGRLAIGPEITYAGGTQSLQRIARPVYWHRQAPSGSRIALGSFPDTDYLSGGGLFVPFDAYGDFTSDLDAILRGAFFNTTDPFARVYTRDRLYFDLWAGPFGANAEGCTRPFGGDALAVSAVVDGSAILHRRAFRDCASLTAGGGGAGSVQASASDPAWLLVHESAHFLLQLSDEYADGGYDAGVPCPNVYASLQSCQSAAPGVGAAATQCAQIGTKPFWRIVSADETMSDRRLASDFHDDAARCVARRIADCSDGACY